MVVFSRKLDVVDTFKRRRVRGKMPSAFLNKQEKKLEKAGIFPKN